MVKSKFRNINAGFLYFYIHFMTEVICFFVTTKVMGDRAYTWLFPLVYDALAFVPQSVIGAISDKYPKLNISVIGIILMCASAPFFSYSKWIPLAILCLGNCCTHIGGAEVTLRASNGSLSHSAIFVAGGSFGVITGKLLAGTDISVYIVIAFVLTSIPFALLAQYYRKDADKACKNPCEAFNYANDKMPVALVILFATIIVIVRGYMGYGIPTSWNKTTLQTVYLFCIMGLGKGLGGVVADLIGVKKTAYLSAILALPFLLLGDSHMMVSLMGVMFFSMTMAITLAVLVSALPNAPGVAFGFTTIGLFLGTVPIFFFKLATVKANCIMLTALTVICLVLIHFTIRKDGKANG